MEAAVEEEKRRLLEHREDLEKSADEIRAGFNQREALLEVRAIFASSGALSPLCCISNNAEIKRGYYIASQIARGEGKAPTGHPAAVCSLDCHVVFNATDRVIQMLH